MLQRRRSHIPDRQGRLYLLFFGRRLEKYALGRDAGGARSAPDRLLAGVRPVRVSHAVNARPSAGEVGEPAAVQLGFDDHGLGKLNIHYLNPTPISNAHVA